MKTGQNNIVLLLSMTFSIGVYIKYIIINLSLVQVLSNPFYIHKWLLLLEIGLSRYFCLLAWFWVHANFYMLTKKFIISCMTKNINYNNNHRINDKKLIYLHNLFLIHIYLLLILLWIKKHYYLIPVIVS